MVDILTFTEVNVQTPIINRSEVTFLSKGDSAFKFVTNKDEPYKQNTCYHKDAEMRMLLRQRYGLSFNYATKLTFKAFRGDTIKFYKNGEIKIEYRQPS